MDQGTCCLEIDSLLAPIAADSPCGDEHIYSRQLHEKLTSLRKAETPVGDEDTSYRRSADWETVVTTCVTALQEQTKDIRLVCHLLEALTQLHGFAGLNLGLEVLARFIGECWDRSNPAIEDGDVELRTAPVENMLDDPDRGTCFPMSVRQLTILGNDSAGCGFVEFQELKSSGVEAQKQLQKYVSTTDPTEFTELAMNVDRSLEQLALVKDAMNAVLREQAPGLTYLRAAILDCQRVVKEYLPQLVVVDECGSSDADGEQGEQIPGIAADTQQPNDRVLRTRNDAYRQLSEVADFLKQIEPHSPIPYLVNRAVDLGRLPFPMLMSRLVREENILNELRREFGISDVNEDVNEEANELGVN